MLGILTSSALVSASDCDLVLGRLLTTFCFLGESSSFIFILKTKTTSYKRQSVILEVIGSIIKNVRFKPGYTILALPRLY